MASMDKYSRRLTDDHDEHGGYHDEDCIEMLEYQDLLLPAIAWSDPERKLKEIRDLKYKSGDVFICSYPKTDVYPTQELADRPSPRTFATHLRYKWLPRQHIENNGKIIVLVRNIKDTAVSSFHFQRRVGYQKNWVYWDYFLRKILSGRRYNSYFDYYLHWDDVMNDNPGANITHVCYEDLQKDCFKELKSLSKWLGLDRSDSTIQSVVDRCRFVNMKTTLEAKSPAPFVFGTKEKPILFRRGLVGDWKNHFTVAQSEEVDRLIAGKMGNSRFIVPLDND